jgi:hypothetical protein
MIYKSINLSYNCSHRSLFKMYLVWAHKTGLTPPLFCIAVPYQTRRMIGNVFMCIRVIEFSCFYDSSIKFWNCSDSVVFWNCSDSVVFWNCSDSVLFWNCSDSVVFWNCSDSVVFWNCSDSVLFCFSFHYLEIFFNIWQIELSNKR